MYPFNSPEYYAYQARKFCSVDLSAKQAKDINFADFFFSCNPYTFSYYDNPFLISHKNLTSISFLNPQLISICGPFPQTQPQSQPPRNIFGPWPRTPPPQQNLQVFPETIRTAQYYINYLSTGILPKRSKPNNPDDNICPICRDELGLGVSSCMISELPCQHLFHYECIVPWLYRSCLCPMCRFKLPEETVSGPLMRYEVRVGNECVEGWGLDKDSGFWDAVVRNKINLRVIVPGWFLSPIGLARSGSKSNMVAGKGEDESILETMSWLSKARRREKVEVGNWGVTIDDDGDTIMSYACN